MTIKSLEIKNISENALVIGDYLIEPNELISIPMNNIDNTMWRNIIALVNSKEIEYKVVDTEIIEEVKEDSKKTKAKKEKVEDVEEVKTNKKTSTKKATKTTSTKKKKEEK